MDKLVEEGTEPRNRLTHMWWRKIVFSINDYGAIRYFNEKIMSFDLYFMLCPKG